MPPGAHEGLTDFLRLQHFYGASANTSTSTSTSTSPSASTSTSTHSGFFNRSPVPTAVFANRSLVPAPEPTAVFSTAFSLVPRAFFLNRSHAFTPALHAGTFVGKTLRQRHSQQQCHEQRRPLQNAEGCLMSVARDFRCRPWSGYWRVFAKMRMRLSSSTLGAKLFARLTMTSGTTSK